MPLYMFFPCRQDGASAMFEEVDLPSDARAGRYARALLDQHESCTHVVAWCGERKVLVRRRRASKAAAAVTWPTARPSATAS